MESQSRRAVPSSTSPLSRVNVRGIPWQQIQVRSGLDAACISLGTAEAEGIPICLTGARLDVSVALAGSQGTVLFHGTWEQPCFLSPNPMPAMMNAGLYKND